MLDIQTLILLIYSNNTFSGLMKHILGMSGNGLHKAASTNLIFNKNISIQQSETRSLKGDLVQTDWGKVTGFAIDDLTLLDQSNYRLKRFVKVESRILIAFVLNQFFFSFVKNISDEKSIDNKAE